MPRSNPASRTADTTGAPAPAEVTADSPSLASVVSGLPVPLTTAPVVFHVGQLTPGEPVASIPPAPRSASYEGPGLSVSVCPDAWEHIARLGGMATLALRRRDAAPGRFLDMHACSPAVRELLTASAVARGLLVPSVTFLLSRYDDEFEQAMVFTCPSLEDALVEAEVDVLLDADPEGAALVAGLEADHGPNATIDPAWLAEVLGTRVADAKATLAAGGAAGAAAGSAEEVWVAGDPDLNDPQGLRVLLSRSWVASPTLTAWWAAYFTSPLASGEAREAAWLWLVEHASDLDGAWWHDRLDPVRLSAPRGVISPRTLPEWIPATRTANDWAAIGALSTGDADEDEDADLR